MGSWRIAFPDRWDDWGLVSWQYGKRPRQWRYVSLEDGQDLEPTERAGPSQPTIQWPDGRIEALRNGASYIDSDAISAEWRADVRAGRKSVKENLEKGRSRRESVGLGLGVQVGEKGVLIS